MQSLLPVQCSSTNWIDKACVIKKKVTSFLYLKKKKKTQKLEEPKLTAGSFSPLSFEMMGGGGGGAFREVTAVAYE